MSDMTMTIGGMTCGHCVGAVRGALKDIDGVDVEHVSVGRATLRFDETKVSTVQITQAVEDEGYTVLEARQGQP